eukprot:3952816-Amphidinium_carterae.1
MACGVSDWKGAGSRFGQRPNVGGSVVQTSTKVNSCVAHDLALQNLQGAKICSHVVELKLNVGVLLSSIKLLMFVKTIITRSTCEPLAFKSAFSPTLQAPYPWKVGFEPKCLGKTFHPEPVCQCQ